MRYSVFIYPTPDSAPIFLNSSSNLATVKSNKANLNRWMSEMGVALANITPARFVIQADGVEVYERFLVGKASLSWREVATPTCDDMSGDRTKVSGGSPKTGPLSAAKN